jgi:hypothetical protein
MSRIVIVILIYYRHKTIDPSCLSIIHITFDSIEVLIRTNMYMLLTFHRILEPHFVAYYFATLTNFEHSKY